MLPKIPWINANIGKGRCDICFCICSDSDIAQRAGGTTNRNSDFIDATRNGKSIDPSAPPVKDFRSELYRPGQRIMTLTRMYSHYALPLSD